MTVSGSFEPDTFGNFGFSVAVSADGKTALVGGFDGGPGAVWVFIREGSGWIQDAKLVPNDAKVSPGFQSEFGASVALSADGTIALIGGPGDNHQVGAAWTFERSGSTWAQQGSKLTPSDSVGSAGIGWSVALSADGNTALIGAPTNNFTIASPPLGAAWVFTRSDSTWTQQGPKLVPTDNSGASEFGNSVALSADGNLGLIGGWDDGGGAGAAWVFSRTGPNWSQQGSKLTALVGQDTVQRLGSSVALAADGTTAVVGGIGFSGQPGSVAVFVDTASGWQQQAKLVGSDTHADDNAGYSVAVSADGTRVLVGEPGGEPNTLGAAVLFGRLDSEWTQLGYQLTGADTQLNGVSVAFGWSVSLDGKGKTALVAGPGDNDGRGAVWFFGNGHRGLGQ
jgi:hypothetical protein